MIDLGASFDWVSPVLKIVQGLRYGRGYTFLVPYSSGVSGRDVTKMLRSKGIKTWGHMIVNKHYMFTVKVGQAGWAQRLLDREEIPTKNPYGSK